VATIVVLNGTSSSGKTTLARAFQELAPTVFLNFSIDSLFDTLPQSARQRVVSGQTIPGLPFQELHRAFYGCVRELASLGRDLIIDNAITARAQAEMLVGAVDGHRVLLVAVGCPAEVLAQRERERGDRDIGLAARQLDTIDRWLDCDLRIDTSRVTAQTGAVRILEALTAGPSTALARTRARLSEGT
jgi:chloramphenicol 3-O phosphotransferase